MSRARHKKASGGASKMGTDSPMPQRANQSSGYRFGGKVMGGKSKMRLDKRARGGRIGSDKSPMAPGSARHPFSSAAR
jgi:hypothetical protein